MDEIEKRVKEVIWLALGGDQDQVIHEASFSDLGADLLDKDTIIVELEDEFKLEIPHEEAEKITTVKQAVDYIQGRMKEPKS